MKQKLMKTPPQHKILEGESQKLKEKLDSLKKQIQAKKKEKEITRSAQNSELKLTQSRKSNQPALQTSQNLNKLLANLKLEGIASKLKEKMIVTVQQLQNIKAEQLDNWKDIAIGYRIKLKKYLESKNKNTNLQQPQKRSKLSSPQKSVEKKLNIQQIIKNRKQGQKYIPLKRNQQETQVNNDKQLEQQQQEFMIQSLKTAFNFHKNATNQDGQYDQMEQNLSQNDFSWLKYEKPIQRVKTLMSQSTMQQYQHLPNYKYCWSCLKMMKDTIVQYNARQFCSELCSLKYKQSVQIQNQNYFFENIEDVENKFQKYMQSRQINEDLTKKAENKKKKVEVQELDLQIE